MWGSCGVGSIQDHQQSHHQVLCVQAQAAFNPQLLLQYPLQWCNELQPSQYFAWQCSELML